MAGGTAGDSRSAWPKGEDACLVPLEFHLGSILASKAADHVKDTQTLRFACYPMFAEFVAEAVTVTNAITVNIEDDSATAKQVITDQAIAAVTDGATSVQALSLASGAKTTKINAGAVLEASYKSGASDTGTHARIRLWVRPVH